MTVVSRRGFLETALGAAALAPLAHSAVALAAESSIETGELRAQPLTPGVTLITGAGANVVALAGTDGALLVDGGLERHAAALQKLVLRETRSKRIATLFNTHWHPEQTGSNERLGKAGTLIVSHEDTKLWLSRKITVGWLEKPFGPLTSRARPTKTTYTTDKLTFGDEEVQYGYMRQAHTDGDLFVKLTRANVIHAGGVVSNAGWPLLDYETGGWIGGLVAGYDTLIRNSDGATRIVPANGAPLGRADLETHRKMYFEIFDRLVKHLNKGLGPDEVVAQQPTKEFDDRWGDSRDFVNRAYRSLWGHYAPDA